MAHAHICAEQALASGGEVAEKAAGQVFFLLHSIFFKICNCSKIGMRVQYVELPTALQCI